MLTVQAHTDPSRPVTALIDPGSQINVITPKLAKEWDLEVESLPWLKARAANGDGMTVYGYTVANVHILDSRGRQQTHQIPFVVSNLARYPIYLGLPWIDDQNPKMNIASRRLLFRGQKVKDRPKFQQIGIEDAEQFEKTLRNPLVDVYACTVDDTGQFGPKGADAYRIPACYQKYAEVGSEDDSKSLPKHGPHDLAIDIADGARPPFKPLYNLSASELEVLRKYIAEYLARGWIRRSKSPAGAPILFAKKKDGSLRLCVDYRGLNSITIKNRCPLPLIAESLERLAAAKVFSKLDMREAYHRIRIKEGDEWKTAFRTQYGHFKYIVMPFSLTNAPAQFQAYINEALTGLIDIICIVYLDDILVFSDTEEEHERHVKEVLKRLREYKLYVNLKKCKWHTDCTKYLGYIISPAGISIDPERVKTIQEWPKPATVRDIWVFIGFMNYYR
jgi:hypothetical protein